MTTKRYDLRGDRGNAFLDDNFQPEIWLCGSGVHEHFDIGNATRFTFCVSDKRPRGEDYYTLEPMSPRDPFSGYKVRATGRVLDAGTDDRLLMDFSAGGTLYCWVELD